MANTYAMYKHPADAAAFDRYYYSVHVPLAKTIPGLEAYQVVGRPVQVQWDGIVVEVVRRRRGVGGDQAQEALVELRPATVLVDPVLRARKRHDRVRIRALGSTIGNFHQACELLVGAEPGIGALSDGSIGGLKLRLVPDDPIVDAPGVVAHGLKDEATPVVARIVVGQIEIARDRPARVIEIGARPGRRELQQTGHPYTPVQLAGQRPGWEGAAEPAEVVGAIRLDVGPGQDNAFPAGADRGHDRWIAEALCDPEARIQPTRVRRLEWQRCRWRDRQWHARWRGRSSRCGWSGRHGRCLG